MTTFYNADIVSVDDQLFETMDCAIQYITHNYKEWCMITHFDTTLVSVEYEDGSVIVKYTMDDEDNADDPLFTEFFDVKYKDMMTIVPDYFKTSYAR